MAQSAGVSTITATFKLSTPAFIAGGGKPERPGAPDPRRAELRLPSVLGVLRFWWRALAWSATAGEGEVQARLEKLREWEGELFGAAASGDGKGGQGRFIARLLAHTAETLESRPAADHVGGYCRSEFPGGRPAHWKTDGSGITYLAGLGLTKWDPRAHRTKDTRVSLPAGTLLKLELRSRWNLSERLDEDRAPPILDALVVMGLLGGIGARSRRGFGSLCLVRLEGAAADIPTSRKSYVDRLESILRPVANASAAAPAPYSAFSAQTRSTVVATSYGKDVTCLHNEMGHRLAKYRGYGFERGGVHRVGGEPVRKPNFQPDHDWMEAVIAARTQDTVPPELAGQVPERAIFGFPHNYNKSYKQSKTSHQIDVYPRATERRGSPLFLHIHEFPGQKPVAVWTLFESRFLPDDMLSNVTVTRFCKTGRYRADCGKPWTVTMAPDYTHIRRFLKPTEGHIGGDWSIILPGPS